MFSPQWKTREIIQIFFSSSNSNSLWTNHFCHPTFAEFCGILFLNRLEPHSFPHLVIAASGTSRRYRGVNPFYSHLITIDLVGWGGRRWHAVFGRDVVPVDSLLDRTVHYGCNTFHRAVTSLGYAIPSRDVCATKLQVNPPIICKCPELSAVEGYGIHIFLVLK